MQNSKEQKSSHDRHRRAKKMLLISGLLLFLVVIIIFVWGSRGIYMQTETTTGMSREQVWQFFGKPQNLATWDKSVAKVEITSSGDPRVGYTFDTIAPAKAGEKEGQRLSYRIEEFAPPERTRIRLVDSPIFKYADWIITLEPTATGTRIVHGVEFVPKLQFSFMTPVLYLSQKNFKADMKYLDEALEKYQEGIATD